MLAGRSWHATDLPGGLTNHNLRVVTDDDWPPLDLVVRCSSSDAGLLGIDRDAEHANTAAAARAGVGAPVVEYRPDLGMLVIGYLDSDILMPRLCPDRQPATRMAGGMRRNEAETRRARPGRGPPRGKTA